MVAYERAKREAEKAPHRPILRACFEIVPASTAKAFQAMLATNDALGVEFRAALKGDPLRQELIDILEQKYVTPPPPPPSPPSPPPASSAVAALQGELLPIVVLGAEGAFDQLHNALVDRLHEFNAAADKFTHFKLGVFKLSLTDELFPALKIRLAKAKEAKDAAFREADGAKRDAAIKSVGATYAGLLVATQIVELRLNIVLVAVASNGQGATTGNVYDVLLPIENDVALAELLRASLSANVTEMLAAQPAAIKRYQYHVDGVSKWAAAANKSAYLSGKIIKAVDILFLAISIYQVWKTPVIPTSGSSAPLTVVGLLPGGVAVSSVGSLASVAATLEAIRKLIAIGALDGAIIAGVANMGGDSTASLLDLQRPTGLSVQQPNLPGGSAARISMPSGKPDPTARPTGPRTPIRPIDDDTTRRALTRENESADALAKAGYNVEQNPKPPPGSTRKPDYKIEGEYADCYAPESETSVRNVWKNIEAKVVVKEQASRIVLNLDDWHGDFASLQKQFKDWAIPGLEEVLVVQNGKVTLLFP